MRNKVSKIFPLASSDSILTKKSCQKVVDLPPWAVIKFLDLSLLGVSLLQQQQMKMLRGRLIASFFRLAL